MINQAERQRSWGWMIVLYIFLAGLGGGTYLFSFILLFWGKYEAIAKIGMLIGPLVVALASILLLFDLGSPNKAYRLFTNPKTLMSSWMTRGAWILTAFIILGLAYALPAFVLFKWLPWNQTSGWGQAIGFTAAALAVIVPIYPGLLLGVIKSIPLWNTSALPPIFFLSGLDTGIAVLALLSIFMPASIDLGGFHLLGTIDIVLVILLLIALFAYIEIVRQSGVTAAASIDLFKKPLFIGGVVVAGLILPLTLFITSISISDIQSIRILDGIGAVLILIGALFLRFSVVNSGLRRPLEL
jgi:formate-dependent nitrite reductase membrane component NrfD